MNTDIECCDPFDGRRENYWMKLEHCGRYLWAKDILSQHDCRKAADMACGTGYGSYILSEVVISVTGFDRNPEYIDSAEKTYMNGMSFCPKYRVLDFDEAPANVKLFSEPVDAVVCFETLEHVKYPEHLLRMFNDMLLSNGLLLLSVPNARYEELDENGSNKDSYHLHIFNKEDMMGILSKTGFKVLNILGQDICNRIVSRLYSDMNTDGEDFDLSLPECVFREIEIRKAAELFAYPDAIIPNESYSYIFECRKIA